MARITLGRRGFVAASGALALPSVARAQDSPLRIAIVATLSGPSAALGQQVRDGFLLGVKRSGGKLGGRAVDVQVIDDELRPEVAVQKIRTTMEGGKLDFVIGPTYSNVLGAIVRPVTAAGTFLISTNAGSSAFAGKGCNPNLFFTSYCNDQIHAAMGQAATDFGYRRAYVLVPNYQAGKDAVAGFKSRFKGEIVDEAYVPLTQFDFSGDLTRIASAKPDCVFTFMPGGIGIALVKQYRQAGLQGIPLLSTFTLDETALPAQGEAALGLYAAASWAPNMDNAANREFVADYEATYGAIPATYAAQTYDGARLIDGSLRLTGGQTSDQAALRMALRAAKFDSVRGPFRFGTNQYPVQDFWLLQVVRRPDGKLQTQTVRKLFSDDVDPYAAQCVMG